MSDFKFQVINPLLHSELRLKIMVALDSLKSADFMYLCQITDSTRGNVSTQITTLKEAGYIEVSKSGIGRFSRVHSRTDPNVHSSVFVFSLPGNILLPAWESKIP